MNHQDNRPIRLGVVGAGRGRSYMNVSEAVGFELVAICDTWEEKLERVGRELNVTTYNDYDRFLQHDTDAVVLCNFFHQHAPFAEKAFSAGKHVMSECAACHTLAEGVSLARAVEHSGKIYMFAENYPYSAYNQEMRRRYQAGEIGNFKYGEGEYVHPDPAEVKLARSCGWDHWRNWIPSTYYCTHSIAPVMYITDTRPVKVNGFVVPYDTDDPTQTRHAKRSDTCAIIICRMDNEAVMKSLHGALRGHGNYVRIHGNKGLMENCRHGDKGRLRIWREPWEKEADQPTEEVYKPGFAVAADLAAKTGHGGGDFFTSYHFAQAIRTGEQPYLDVYRGIDMSVVGILAWQSALNDSAPIKVPDFRDEQLRKQYENDDWSPDPERKGEGQPPSSVLGEIDPPTEAKDLAREIWSKQGYAVDI